MSKYFKDKPQTKPKQDLTVLYDFIGGKLDLVEFFEKIGRESKYRNMRNKDKEA